MSTRVDVPAGSGLGSSSTLVVAMVAAYAEWLNLPLGEYEIAHTAYAIEREEAGLQGGKQDQYAAVFGGFNFMEFGGNGRVLVNPLRIKERVVSELEASLLLFFTGKSRASAQIIEDQSRNVIDRNVPALEAMHATKEEAFRMKECLLRGNFEILHDVLRHGWECKKQMSKSISNQHIEAIYNCALNAGAYSGKISGAGGGGFMMLFADPTNKDNVANSLRAFCGEGAIYTCHFTAGGVQAWRVT
jgi:D-glycero-alpha-D-manno-heptose-7-phosphate kinase